MKTIRTKDVIRYQKRFAIHRYKQYHQRIKERAKLPVKMLFSSYGFNNSIMRKKFAEVIPQNETLNTKTCVIIPYAGCDVKKTGEREKQGLVEFGFNQDKIQIVNEHSIIGYQFPDYIYVPGGDPFKLLRMVKDSSLQSDIVNCVKNKRSVYIGVSAGAYLATKNIEYVTQFENNNYIKESFDALSLVSKKILCHYDRYSSSTLKNCENISKLPIMTINDNQLLMLEDGIWNYI